MATPAGAMPEREPWLRALALRVRTLWVLKMFGTTLGIAGFFALYFRVMPRTGDQVVTVPMLAVDRWIGVSELALLPYVSLWLYVSLAPALADNLRRLRDYVGGALVIACVGLVTYWLFPTMTPSFGTDWSAYPALRALKASDLGGNAFPSLHVAFAAYTAAFMGRELRILGAPRWLRTANVLWCIAIVYSTLATRQHVVIDVVGGLLLSWLAWQVCRTLAQRSGLWGDRLGREAG